VSVSSIATKQIPNPTPGEVLLLEFIEPMGLTQNGLARAIGVPPRRINEIVRGTRSITADTDLRPGTVFRSPEGFWLGLHWAGIASGLCLHVDCNAGNAGRAHSGVMCSEHRSRSTAAAGDWC
jgi:addiction module HigA family antidote